MNKKNFNDLLNEIKNISEKLNDSNTSMEESIELFKKGTELIKEAKDQLTNLEGEVKKVLENNEFINF
ncbi:exodeoxyribonuclease VII small subunit [Spiroplasma floricola]|uniref:Exodeoxyribonuclease 7 small subunit n=1 Tax=Spiroplasma floricola 23-6 TaxID=1336749 RepID=A0A2K8SE81_9MOLU|nr:exodeoxyribonuclease VII small subunit [Spiroplasma floricola]AUB31645.1 exodeoxyribonuclease VII small subunit [Spiroplasma floricola 23-6]